MFTYILLIFGFIFLIKGAELLVDGSSSLAKRFKISNLVIGLTIVALGTSAPELVINIISSLKGSADLAIGNIVGSTIANILLIGGIAAMIYPLKILGGTAKKEIPLSLGAIILLLLLANDFFLPKTGMLFLSRLDGVILLGSFLIFIYYTFGLLKTESKETEEYPKHHFGTTLAYIVIGVAGLSLGGKWVVESVSQIALDLGFSQALMGLTIIAIGTSLPELATSAVAAYKKNADLAIGNIVGSNIFNIFWILGLSAIIKPLAFNESLNTDILVAIGSTVILFYFVLTGKENRRVERWEGVALFCLYMVYLTFLIWRG
ncbi:MAG: calcium/sodium antiporter [Candidatus Buchananbacteria bacterium]|nr:calcium/sodium antiporter [Candidatus Buchananbacteria bacterium]